LKGQQGEHVALKVGQQLVVIQERHDLVADAEVLMGRILLPSNERHNVPGDLGACRLGVAYGEKASGAQQADAGVLGAILHLNDGGVVLGLEKLAHGVCLCKEAHK
jgi:hypothetical protein